MANNAHNRDTMYVPAWQGLTLRGCLARPTTEQAPFPLTGPRRIAFHTARSAIYHLFKKLVESGRRRVLAPDYHMGNELRAIRAAGAQVGLYRIGRDGRPDIGELSRHCPISPWSRPRTGGAPGTPTAWPVNRS